ncbi:MAG: DUF4115 domain-containing protein [Negativicutes bacterium]|nr:DUF4115 domain-containing protein [Negativicutes bacterium]
MQTLGDILRAAREKQGISVKDVEKATSIRAIYIQAIEDGNYEILPGEVYLKGFIRNYANFLSLNGQEMVNLYRQSLVPEAAVPVEPAVNEKKERTRTEKKEPAANSGSSGKWLTGAVVLLVIAGAVWLAQSYWNGPSAPPTPAPQSQNQSQSQSTQPAPPPQAAPQKPPAPATPAAPAAKSIVIVAKFTELSWILATADGKVVYEGIPKVGESLTWTADRRITLRVGNAQGVDLTLNGQPQGKMGGDGEVLEKTFNAGPAPTNIQKQ